MKFLYQHVSFKTGNVFYVGIGTLHSNKKTLKKKFLRAYTFSGRTKGWNNVKDSDEIEVQILKVGNKREISWLETLLIKYYGRLDLKTGLLVNNSDGDFSNDSNRVFTKDWKNNISKAAIKRGLSGENNPFYGETHSEHTKQKMRGKRESSSLGNNHKAIGVLNMDTGIYYSTIKEAALYNDIGYSNLKHMLSGKHHNKTNLIKV